MESIESQFDLGIKKVQEISYAYQLEKLEELCKFMVETYLPEGKEFSDVTGNTITSYSYGIYYRGSLVLYGNSNKKPAIMPKLSKGDQFYGISYDGFPGKYYATVKTDRGYGDDTAFEFLSSYRPEGKGFSVVITTGTEYSAYLENVKELNVLSESIDHFEGEFFHFFKPMK